MFRRIVATLLLIEGGIFFSAGLAPGVEDALQRAFFRHPELISATQAGELVSFFVILQRIALAFGLLCVMGGWGAMQGSKWGRWTAMVASALNLPLFPVFTPLGIAGLFVFSRAEKTGVEESAAKPAPKSERPEPISHVLVMVASLAMVIYLSRSIRGFAVTLGLPVDLTARMSFQWLLIGQLVFTLVHELGHLLAAWAVGFQFHEINVGPMTLTERPGGSWAVRFDAARLLMSGGYLKAVPRTEKDLRMNWILVVVAGPAASLFLALCAFLVLILLPGTAYAGYWDWAAYACSICLADCAANLLPLGLTDGALLFHAVFNTARGKGVLAGLEAAMLNDRADRKGGLMDPAELLENRRQALEQLEKTPDVPGLALALQRIEFARASLRNGRTKDAAESLAEAHKLLDGLSDVPEIVWFRYWFELFESATARGEYSSAAAAREKALEIDGQLDTEKMDWEDIVPIRIACARMWMSDNDFFAAIQVIQATREKCPARRSVTAHAAELLAAEAECEVRLGRRESAENLAQGAIEIAMELPDPQRSAAMELLAHSAVRLSAAGECAFAQLLFAAAVDGLEKSASVSIAAGYRTAWAESLYENGKLEESAAVLRPVNAAGVAFTLDVETLRAQLLLAEDRPEEALSVLTPLLADGDAEAESAKQVPLARSRALRSWALYRSGSKESAVEEARKACDFLMPVEHPDAAPALLTMAMTVFEENPDLSEAYVQEGMRLICDTNLFSPLTKASRLTDLARSSVQANRKDWARDLLGRAAKYRGVAGPAPAPAPAVR